MEVLKIENLCKTYPAFKLDNVSFSMQEGSIMGFIGRNGAGKTTTMKTMLRFVHPENGTVEINGIDISKDEFAVKKIIGFVSGTDCFYGNSTIKKVTAVTKKFYPEWDEAKYRELLQKFNLDETKQIKKLSAGMKIKYQVALAMSHDAKLLILDEPTSGLDPVSRDELVIIFEDYVADKKHSILFSTHITSDLEKCADSITYIKAGKIIANTGIRQFAESYVMAKGNSASLTDELKAKIIGLHVRAGTEEFEGFVKAEEKALFENAAGIGVTAASLEEIMVHLER